MCNMKPRRYTLVPQSFIVTALKVILKHVKRTNITVKVCREIRRTYNIVVSTAYTLYTVSRKKQKHYIFYHFTTGEIL